jgi:hypothetical protein
MAQNSKQPWQLQGLLAATNGKQVLLVVHT